MSWTTPRTWVASELVTAAIMNTHIRDNLSSIWPYTTTGDLSYKSSSASLARLAIGSDQEVLGVSTSGLPEWQSPIGCSISRSSAQSIPNNTVTEISSFDTEIYDNSGFHSGTSATIAKPAGYADGLYMFVLSGYFSGTGSSSTYREIGLYKDSSEVVFASSQTSDAVASATWMNLTTIYNWTSAASTFSMSVVQKSGGALNFNDAKLVAIKLR